MNKLKAIDVIDIDDDFLNKIAKKLNIKEDNTIYSVTQIAEITNQTNQTILNHIKKGILLATQPGGKNYNITHEAFKDYQNIKKK